MKKFKLFAFLMACVMLSACLFSCAAKEKTVVNTTVTVFVDDEIAFGPASNGLEIDEGTQATILQCMKEIFILNEIDSEDDGMSFTSIGGNAEKEDGEYTYYWEFTINGTAPESGRAGTIVANDGDVIIFNYVKVLTSELIAAEEQRDQEG